MAPGLDHALRHDQLSVNDEAEELNVMNNTTLHRRNNNAINSNYNNSRGLEGAEGKSQGQLTNYTGFFHCNFANEFQRQ